jgi:hypothetical protein
MSHRAHGGPSPPPRWDRGIALGTVASLLAHGAFLAYVGMRLSTPDVGIAFELPQEMEFGLTEAVEVEAAPGGDEPAPEDGEPGAVGDGVPENADDVDQDRSESDEDPDPSEQGEQPKPRPERKAKVSTPKRADDGDGFGTRALPPGAQLALRMNMERVRASPLAPNIRRLLANVPDWQAVLGGSGLEPVDDLARILIATPDLHRSKVVIAGRHEGDSALPRDIVARMAAAHGKPAEWTRDEGVPVAPWPDRDVTERRIALIGRSHFAISRPQDLPRLLAIAQARQARQAQAGEEGEGATLDPEAWGKALLALGDDEALTLEVEGARHFVRGPMADRFPIRLRVAAEDRPNGHVRLTAEGTYDTPQAATDALVYAERVREAYARNVLLQLSGMARVLREAKMTQDGEQVKFRTELTLDQTRLLLGYIEGFLVRGQPPAKATGGRLPQEEPTPDTEDGSEDPPPPNPYLERGLP